MINHKLFSVDYMNVIKNFKNIECSYDVSLSLHQKSDGGSDRKIF